jgi:uncharacterized MAPEG superfamily protein
MQDLSPELFWLSATTLFTALLWLPYTIALISQWGLGPALMDTEHEFRLESAWARRAQRAHANAVENLIIFAVLILTLEVTGANTATTAIIAAIFFWLRVAHYFVYVGRVPVIRTVLFFAGFICQMIIGLALFGFI